MNQSFKYSLFILVFSILSISGIYSQPVYYSNYFKNPETVKEFVIDCAQFWVGVHDNTYGGFFTGVDRTGNVFDTKKHIVSQSRDAYGFAKAFMLTGNEDYLTYSNSALQFMYDHLWDVQYKGWFKYTNASGGNPYTGEKSAFDQHYALLGITAYFEATGDSSHLHVIDSALTYMDDVFWDETASQEGYFDHANRDGSGPSDKSFNSTLDAITTHLYSLYLMTEDTKYLDRLNTVKGNILDNFYANMPAQAIGFPEEYFSNWTIDESETLTIMGHVLKTGWSLGRIHRVDPDQTAVTAAQDLIQDVLDNGYDHTYGGPYKDYNRVSGTMEMWGAYDVAKAWWQMEQAITAGMMLFEITWDQKYLEMADESLDFFMKYFVDPVYGEVYADRSETGGRVEYSGGYWDENKGSDWKAAYHSIETGYFAYIYGKLLLKQEPVTLFYKYESIPTERSIKLSPVSVDFSKLAIDAVTLDEVEYLNFNSSNRLLTIPANTGGVFAVTFSMSGLDDVIANTDEIISENIEVYNYPNPFTESTKFIINSNKSQNADLLVYNSSGKIVKHISNISLTEGKNSIDWNSGNLPQGIYLYKIKSENSMYSGKCLLIR